MTKYFNNSDQTALIMQLVDCNAAALNTSGDQLSEDCSATTVRRSNKLRRSHYTKLGSGELFRTFVVVCYLRRDLVAAATMLQILRLRLFARRICVCSAVATIAGKI